MLRGTLLSIELAGAGDETELQRVGRLASEALPDIECWGGLRSLTKIVILPDAEQLGQRANLEGIGWAHAAAQYGVVNLQAPHTWASSDDQLRRALVHELTHCAMYQAASEEPQRRRIPRWFAEGMAIWTARQDPRLSLDELSSRLRADPWSDPLNDADAMLSRNSGVVFAAAYWAFASLAFRGPDQVREVLAKMRLGMTFERGFADAFNQTLETFVGQTLRAWRGGVTDEQSPVDVPDRVTR